MTAFLGGKYLPGRQISSRDNVSVFRGVNILTCQDVIIKREKIVSNAETPSQCEREFSLLSSIPQHPNVVQVVELIKTDSEHNLILKSSGTFNLSTYLSHIGSLDEIEARSVFSEVCLGLQHLHAHGIVHSNLKPDKIILTHSLQTSLCGFGSSRSFPSAQSSSAASSELNQTSDIKRPDFWRLGLVLHWMLAGQPPESVDSPPSEIENYTPPTDNSPEAVTLLKKLLTKEGQISSIEDVLVDPWFSAPLKESQKLTTSCQSILRSQNFELRTSSVVPSSPRSSISSNSSSSSFSSSSSISSSSSTGSRGGEPNLRIERRINLFRLWSRSSSKKKEDSESPDAKPPDQFGSF